MNNKIELIEITGEDNYDEKFVFDNDNSLLEIKVYEFSIEIKCNGQSFSLIDNIKTDFENAIAPKKLFRRLLLKWLTKILD